MKFFRWCFLLAPICAVFTSHTYANEDWWFDVEVIAFKRNVSLSELEEQFTLASTLEAPRAQANLIGAIITPDISYLKQGLPLCDIDTTIPLPVSELLYVPSSDVDFLALPPLEEANSEGSALFTDEHNAIATGETGSLGATEVETTEVESDADIAVSLADEAEENVPDGEALSELETLSLADTELATPNDVIQGPSATEIAKLWLSFFGVSKPSDEFSDSVESNSHSSQNANITVPAFRYCEQVKPWMEVSVLNGQKIVKVNKPDNRLPSPSQLPIIVEGHDWPRASKAHLLTSNEHALTSISKQIRSNRELERLFHVAWRQPVMFGKDNAFDVRLFGGKNYASSFAMSGQPIKRPAHESADDTDTSVIETNPLLVTQGEDTTSAMAPNKGEQTTSDSTGEYASNEYATGENDIGALNDGDDTSITAVRDIFADLEDKLATPTPIALSAFSDLDALTMIDADNEENANALRKPIWEIDGTMKVFLKYINRVPYLHIDSELLYRQPVSERYFAVEPSILNADDSVNAAIAESDLVNNNSDTLAYTPMRLVAVPLKEQRRVISTQLHYFDHPLFGFVVQIRRYNRPAVEVSEEN
ncbi:CsiV family protein [Alteromonas sp. S167]|uniref:CsiV family protein n=1 Tax=Alteromonas sp. S167 TaxID=3117402 RepID=UPI002FE074BD